MSWNYRICVEEHPPRVRGLVFTVREVYYTEDGIPEAYSASPNAMAFESVDYLTGDGFDVKEDFLEYLDLLKRAADKPVIWIGDRFPEVFDPENIQPEENGEAEIS